ncbi:MAG: hypothetical protein RIQ33_1941 [Bacteroidota bacterium]|jgi:hypothetical protein
MNLLLKNLLLNNFINKKTIFIMGFSCLYSSSFAQINYIPNPSFEFIDTCYILSGTINNAVPWDTLIQGGGGPNLFSTCSFGLGNRSPYTGAGIRTPRTGDAFIAEDIYISVALGRYYSQVPLKQTLVASQNYTVTFYVSRCACSQYCIDRIGAYLDNGSISTTYGGLVNVIPQVENQQHSIITDTVNWTKIQGCFTATGTESYLTLGNFYPDSLVDTASAPYNPNYGVVNNSSYFIDDVSVIESNSIIKADNDTIINKGDTITLGKSIEGMPVDWYDLQGNLLAASSTINVSPTTTTSYVVKMDLCGNVSFDTVTVSVATGMEDVFKTNEVSIYPNPTTGNFTLSIPKDNYDYSITITTTLGQLQYTQIFKNTGITTIQQTLPKGIYYLNIKNNSNNEFTIKKLIVE